VDGNVLRVIARLEGDAGDIGAAATRARFEKVAQGLLDRKDPGRFNQAMMELGATVCLPRNPLCLVCPVSGDCRARIEGSQAQLPVKLKRGERRRVETTLLIIERAGKLLLWRRDQQARRLGGFWELPSAEDLPDARTQRELGSFRHSITNHDYLCVVRRAKVAAPPEHYAWFERPELDTLALSTVTRKAIALAMANV
jgi:A/G-specific adenine glycosylase